jgi:hypothetical protein
MSALHFSRKVFCYQDCSSCSNITTEAVCYIYKKLSGLTGQLTFFDAKVLLLFDIRFDLGSKLRKHVNFSSSLDIRRYTTLKQVSDIMRVLQYNNVVYYCTTEI